MLTFYNLYFIITTPEISTIPLSHQYTIGGLYLLEKHIQHAHKIVELKVCIFRWNRSGSTYLKRKFPDVTFAASKIWNCHIIKHAQETSFSEWESSGKPEMASVKAENFILQLKKRR